MKSSLKPCSAEHCFVIDFPPASQSEHGIIAIMIARWHCHRPAHCRCRHQPDSSVRLSFSPQLSTPWRIALEHLHARCEDTPHKGTKFIPAYWYFNCSSNCPLLKIIDTHAAEQLYTQVRNEKLSDEQAFTIGLLSIVQKLVSSGLGRLPFFQRPQQGRHISPVFHQERSIEVEHGYVVPVELVPAPVLR